MLTVIIVNDGILEDFPEDVEDPVEGSAEFYDFLVLRISVEPQEVLDAHLDLCLLRDIHRVHFLHGLGDATAKLLVDGLETMRRLVQLLHLPAELLETFLEALIVSL